MLRQATDFCFPSNFERLFARNEWKWQKRFYSKNNSNWSKTKAWFHPRDRVRSPSIQDTPLGNKSRQEKGTYECVGTPPTNEVCSPNLEELEEKTCLDQSLKATYETAAARWKEKGKRQKN